MSSTYKWIIGVTIFTLSAMASTAVFGQRNTDGVVTTSRTDEAQLTQDDSRRASTTFVRPRKLPDLQAFVRGYFADTIDVDSILETFAEGKPAITFSLGLE